MSARDPLAGMPEDLRASYDAAPKQCRLSYVWFFINRDNKAAAHRDTWPAYLAGWLARQEQYDAARHRRTAAKR